jgi:hypothetical protein
MMMTTTKTTTVYEVLYHDDHSPYAGAAGDGSFIARFRRQADAEKFASAHRCYGRPATVTTTDASPAQLRRWGLR